MKLSFKTFLSVGGLFALFSTPLYAGVLSTNPENIASLFSTHSLPVYLLLFFAIGLLLSFTPCVLPMVPILSGIVARRGGDGAKGNAKLALSFVMGMASMYAIAGILAALFGASLQTLMQTPWVILTFSLLIAFFSLSLFDVIKFSAGGSTAKQNNNSPQRKGHLSVFVMGAVATIVVSPCVTAPLLAVLLFISQSGQVVLGGSVLFVMALGMGAPLIVFAAGQGALLPKSGAWMLIVKTLFGYLLLAMSVWLASRVINSHLTFILSSSLIAAFTFHLGTHLGRLTKKWQKVLFIVLTLSIGIGASLMNVPSSPLKQDKVAAQDSFFEVINNPQVLEEKLAKARRKKKPVFLEFYASWCGDCTAMDKKVFSQPEVREALKPFVRLRVDLSLSTPTTRHFKEDYHIFGTPTLMFYDKDGKQLSSLTAAGFIDKGEFLTLIKKA